MGGGRCRGRPAHAELCGLVEEVLQVWCAEKMDAPMKEVVYRIAVLRTERGTSRRQLAEARQWVPAVGQQWTTLDELATRSATSASGTLPYHQRLRARTTPSGVQRRARRPGARGQDP